jgi:hypothetical protein
MRIAKGNRRRRVAVLLAMCVLMPAGMARAADPAPASDSAVAESNAPLAAQIAGLRSRYQKAQQDAFQAYSASQGKPDAERIKIYQEKLPKPHPYAMKAMELASQHPKDPGAVEALRFVIEITGQGQGSSEDARLRAEAINQLSQGQLNDPGLASVFPTFMYEQSQAGEKLMRLAAEKSTNRDVRGSAMFWLAQSLRTASERSGNPQQLAEAKKLYQQVDAQYADVKTARGTLGDQAKANLFEMENLAVGKAAPEIEGKDQDGKALKLSAYRGKVVMLDFWGDW